LRPLRPSHVCSLSFQSLSRLGEPGRRRSPERSLPPPSACFVNPERERQPAARPAGTIAMTGETAPRASDATPLIVRIGGLPADAVAPFSSNLPARGEQLRRQEA